MFMNFIHISGFLRFREEIGVILNGWKRKFCLSSAFAYRGSGGGGGGGGGACGLHGIGGKTFQTFETSMK